MRRYEHGGDIYAGDEISLDFSVNINPLGMPEPVAQAVAQALPGLARYPDPACRALRAALSARYGIPPGAILCGNGASELILALCAGTRPRRVVTLAPTFSEYERTAALFGGKVREHRLRESEGFALTRRLLDELTPETQLLFLCNPNNPTGRLADSALLWEAARICRENGTLLLLDECFIEFTREPGMLSSLKEYPNLLILRAFTKSHAMAGLRLGVLCCADEALLERVAGFCPAWNVSGAAQAAGLAALRLEGWMERTRRIVEEERAFLSRKLESLGLTVFRSDANFLLIRSGRPLYGPLRERGILTRGCGNFTGLDERYLRVGIRTREENMALVRALSEVLDG